MNISTTVPQGGEPNYPIDPTASSDNSLISIPLDRKPSDRLVDGFSKLAPKVAERLLEGDRVAIQQQSKQFAQATKAQQRYDNLATIADSGWNPQLRLILTLLVGVVTTVMVGTGFGAILGATGRGTLAQLAGTLAVSGLAVGTEVSASHETRKRAMRRNTLAAVDEIETSLDNAQPTTETEGRYYAEQKQLVREVEAVHLAEPSPADTGMLGIAIGIEGLLAFWLTLPAGLGFALVSATFPIVFNLIVAKVGSDRLEVPEACEKLLPIYEAHLAPDLIAPLEAMEIERLQAAIEYVSLTRSPKGVRSVGQAKALVTMQFAKQQMQILTQRGISAGRIRVQRYEEESAKVSERCPRPQVPVGGLTGDEAQQAEQVERDRWLEEEQRKLDKRLKADLEKIKADYGAAIDYWQVLEEQGKQEYRDHEPEDREFP